MIDGELDGAQMLAGQPWPPTSASAPAELVTAFAMDPTVTPSRWPTASGQPWATQLPKPVAGEVPPQRRRPRVVAEYRQGQVFNMGMVFPVSPQLRAEVLAGGGRPASRLLRTQARRQLGPAPGGRAAVGDAAAQMPATLEWRHHRRLQRGALEPAGGREGFGAPPSPDQEIWRNNPEKVFGVTRQWAERHPNTQRPLGEYAAAGGLVAGYRTQRQPARGGRMLAKPEYVGADEQVIASSMTGTFEYAKRDKRQPPDFNVSSATTPPIPTTSTPSGI